MKTTTRGTSWASVLGGWLAAVGMAALVAPAIGVIMSGRPAVPNDLSLAVPVVIGLVVAYLVGGYVAGRMAGYSTSWHGMMVAFFGLFITLIALLLAAAADQGLLAASGVRSLSDVFPGIAQLDMRTLGDTVTFGAILGFLAAIFAGWLGGVLAPEHAVAVAVTRAAVPTPTEAALSRDTERTPAEAISQKRVEQRPTFRLLPAIGRKGGETSTTTREEVRETKVQR